MFRRTRRVPAAVPIRRVIPSVITAMSLCAGLASMHFSIKAALGGARIGPDGINDWDRALALIFAATILDALDGRAARLLRATSRFGAVLDSLADFLAFGVAPGLLLHLWLLKDADVFGLTAVMAFVLCSALRLARFTAARPVSRTSPLAGKFFEGLPTPAAAAIVLIPPLLYTSGTMTRLTGGWNTALSDWGHPVVVIHTLAIAWLMVSRVPMFSFKKLRIKRRWIGQILAVVAILAAAMIRDPWLTVAVVGALYLLTIPLSVRAYRRLRAAMAAPAEGAGAPGDGWPAGESPVEAVAEPAIRPGNGRRPR